MPLRRPAHSALNNRVWSLNGSNCFCSMLPSFIQPGRRAAHRVLILQPMRRPSSTSSTRFSSFFNAYRPHQPEARPWLNKDFYSPSWSRRISSSARRTATAEAVLSQPPPIPFPIQTHSIPTSHEALHTALQELNARAPEFVNQSRLQLALRGLESTAPKVRIAVVGISEPGFRKAKRLVRLLVADPLDNEGTSERKLLEHSARDNRAVLVQYSDIDQETGPVDSRDSSQHPLLKTVGIKSPGLNREGVEILVAHKHVGTKPGENRGVNRLEDALLPVLDSPLAGSGRAGFVRFPVHKTIVLGESSVGALAVSPYLSDETELGNELVKGVVDFPVSDASLSSHTINVAAAEQALVDFRRDVRTGPRYSETWQSSGLSQLSEFFKVDRSGPLPAALKNHISSLLTSSEASIDTTQQSAEDQIKTRTVPEAVRDELQGAITSWSEYAHTDLQDTLTAAFASRTWQRTSFPRVLWRIDDVSYSAASLLHTNFLIETETYLAFLVGRIGGAGYFNNERSKDTSPEAKPSQRGAATEIDPVQGLSTYQLTRMSETREQIKAETGIDPFVAKPWPVGLTACRHTLLTALVPSLHARAQALVLECSGLIGTTSALGIWYVVASAGAGLFEAGAIVGLGTVWALRRLQKLWGAERTKFEAEVREQGRVALGDVEARLRAVVRNGRRPQVRAEDRERWSQARAQTEKCRALLSKLMT